jgi:hypothetical protein
VAVDLRNIPSGSTLNVVYEISIPMDTFDLLCRIRYIPSFFGNWHIHIIPTLNNMIYMWDGNAEAHTLIDNYNKHSSAEWFSYGQEMPDGPTDSPQPQAQFTVQDQGYAITELYFHTAQFTFREPVYRGLLEDYNSAPLRFGFTQARWTTSPFIWNSSSMAPVQQQATSVDCLFVTFHTGQFDKAAPKQPFMRGVKIVCEGAGTHQIYTSSGSPLNTYDNDVQYNWFLDAFNMNGNVFSSPPTEYHTSMLPFNRSYTYALNAATGTYDQSDAVVYLKRGSISDFILGIPMAPDGTFNEGVHSENKMITWNFTKTNTLDEIPCIRGSSNTPEIGNPNKMISSIVFTSVFDFTCQLIATPSSTTGQAIVT